MALCVTTFDSEPKRKLVLQYSACARRIAKIAMVLIPIAAKLGSMRPQQLRHVLDELHEAQFMSSQEGQGLGALDDIQVLATMKFIDRKRVVSGKGVSVRVELGGRRCIKNKSNR